ncbi:MAG: lysozyme inhibitor LprI family protein [Syntrophobacteraceae bacterium]
MKTSTKTVLRILLPLFIFALTALDLSAAENDCNDAVSTAEMRTCANKLYEAADAELNQVYRQLASKLSDKRRESLKAAQQAWITFRDKNATFAASAVEDGTMYPVLEVAELTALTKQRTEQLRAYLK